MPYLSSTIFVVVLVLAVLVSLTGYLLLARALFPAFVERAERAWTDRPVGVVALGVPVTAVLALVSGALMGAPVAPLRVLGFLAAGVALGFTLAGTAGLAARIGQRLPSPTDQGREWARVLRAGVVLELSMLFPILGWFLVLPAAVLGGAGAATLALLRAGARAPQGVQGAPGPLPQGMAPQGMVGAQPMAAQPMGAQPMGAQPGAPGVPPQRVP